MPRYGPTLFDYLQGQVAREQQLLDQEKQRQRETMETDRTFWADYLNKEADRALKLKELESRSAGALGRPAPHRDEFDSRLEEAVQPHYMAGEVDFQKRQDAEALKRFQAEQQFATQEMLEGGRNQRSGENLELRQAIAEQNKALAEGRLEEAKRWHDIMAQMQGGNRFFQQEMMRMRFDEAKRKSLDTDTQKAGKELQDLGGMQNDLRTLLAATSKNDVPGVGPVAGLVPDLLMTEDGTEVRRAANRSLNALLRAQSGLTVSDQEALRTMAATKLSQRATNAQFIEGVKELAQYVQLAMRNKQAGFRPEVIEEYRSRGGTTSQEMPTAETAEQKAARWRRAVGM